MLKVTDKEKLDFLNELLETDKNFYAKFVKHFEVKNKVSNAYKTNSLEKLADEIFALFNNLDVDVECYCDYSEEYDNVFIEDLFIELEKQINNNIRKDEFYEGVFILVAIYKAIYREPILNDEYGVIYDYQDMLFEYLYYLSNKVVNKSLFSLQNDIKKKTILLLSQNLNVEQLKFFENILNVLIDSKEMAVFTIDYIECFYITIQLKILDLLDNDELFIKSAKQFYLNDNKVASMLLRKLKTKALYDDFETISKQLFSTESYYFVDDILDGITYEKSKDFYIEVLIFRSIKKSSFDNYKMLKKYLDKEHLNSYYLMVKKENVYLYIQILKFEKMYSSMLELAYEFKDNGYIEIDKIIKPIKSFYPKELLEIIKFRCDKLMSGYDRNRKTYITIVSLLKLVLEEKEIETDLKSYILTLYNHKPNLPALKDEFRKAQLI